MSRKSFSQLQAQYGDLHQVIPHMVNELGQLKASQKLGTSVATINRWLKENHYNLSRIYVKEGGSESGAGQGS